MPLIPLALLLPPGTAAAAMTSGIRWSADFRRANLLYNFYPFFCQRSALAEKRGTNLLQRIFLSLRGRSLIAGGKVLCSNNKVLNAIIEFWIGAYNQLPHCKPV